MRPFVFLSTQVIALGSLCAQPVVNNDASSPRERFVETQNEVRALVARKEGHPPARDYFSSALETTNPGLLEAHREFELGVESLLQEQPSKAREHWNISLRLLASGDAEGKQWVRRANAAIVQQEIIELHKKGDAALMAELVSQAKAVVDEYSLPAAGSTPAMQLRLEHWIFSSEIMFRFAHWLPDAPKDGHLAGAKRALEEICRHRLLTEKMISRERSADHEALIDRVVFEKGMPGLFVSLFYNLERTVF